MKKKKKEKEKEEEAKRLEGEMWLFSNYFFLFLNLTKIYDFFN